MELMMFQKSPEPVRSLRKMDRTFLQDPRHSTKLGGRLKCEKHDFACVHPKITMNDENTPKSSKGILQKRQIEKQAIKNEELIKYMSNLPSYLERGNDHQEKALNFGVLDWQLLEKWQVNLKHTPVKSGRNSPSTSNSSSFFSTDESSSRSGKGHSCSPARQRANLPILQPHLHVSCPLQHAKSFGENVQKLQELAASPKITGESQKGIVGDHQSLSKKNLENQLKGYKKEVGSHPEILNDVDKISCLKGKMKIQDVEPTKRLEKTRANCHEKNKTVVHELQSIGADGGKSDNIRLLNSRKIQNRRSLDASWRDFSEASNPKEVYRAEPITDISRICSLPSTLDGMDESHAKQTRSKEVRCVKIMADDLSVMIDNNVEEKSTTMHITSSLTRISEPSDANMGFEATVKLRNSSPTNRFGLRMQRIRSPGSKDSVPVPQPSFKHFNAKCGSENVGEPLCLVDSNRSKSNGRGRSSPLRRLFEPLLKPKMANSSHSAEKSCKESIRKDKICKASVGRDESSTLHLVKLKLDLKNCKTIDIHDLHQNEKRRSSFVQGLVQVAVKNGLPLFTLAVDNNSGILAATMKKSNFSEKHDISWIYTMLTVREVKKNGNWLHHGVKFKDHGYIPNVVAHVKVSDSLLPCFMKQNSMAQSRVREFVLFAVDQHKDNQQSEFHPNDELAAIIVRFPENASFSLNQCAQQDRNSNGSLQSVQREPRADAKAAYSNSTNSAQHGSCVGGQDLFCSTVILPGGCHGHPSKGEPTSLIERWKSGGSCDCGGWDLGCGLRVLGNQNPLNQRSRSTKTQLTAGQFDLYPQGVEHDKPFFSLAPFKDGIFSVEFDSSLSLQQAFAICIATLSSRKPPLFSEWSNTFDKNSDKITSVEVDGSSAPNGLQMEAPTKYTSYPPLSPVGRV